MKKIFLQSPYTKELNSNIISRKLIDNKLHIICDKTIFIPEYDNFAENLGTINGIKVLKVYKRNTEICHVLEEKPDTSKLKMKINWNNRYKLMQNNTAQYLTSSYLSLLYYIKTFEFNIYDNYIDISLQKNLDKFHQIMDKVIGLVNNLIDTATNISTEKLLLKEELIKVKVSNLVEVNDSFPHVSNTSEIKIVLIKRIENIGNRTRVYFYTGKEAIDLMKNIYENSYKISSEYNCDIKDINFFINSRIANTNTLNSQNNKYKEKLTEAFAKIINLSNNKLFEIDNELSLYDLSRYIIKDSYTIYKKDLDKIVFLTRNSEKNLKTFFSNFKFQINGSGSNLIYRGEFDSTQFENFSRKISEL